MSGEHSGNIQPHPKHCQNRFGRTLLRNTLCRIFKTEVTLCGHAPLCNKNAMSACLAPWMTEITWFLQFLQEPQVFYFFLQKGKFNNPLLACLLACLLAECTLYGAFCRMEWHLHDSWIFRGPEPHTMLVHKHTEAEVDFTGSLRWLRTASKTVKV